MSEVNININRAVVTAVKEFTSAKGYGVDFYVEAQCIDCTVYLQIACYDNEARRYYKDIHEGDLVNIAGDLKVKPYVKKDGSTGCSLLVERPVEFTKIAGSNSEQQILHAVPADTVSQSIKTSQTTNAVTAVEEYEDDDDFMDRFLDKVEAESTKEQQPGVQSKQSTPYYAPKKTTFTIGGETYEAYENDEDEIESPF